jgi:adenosylhomocysteine nucleosidase
MDVRACYAVARVNTKRAWPLIGVLAAAALLAACATREVAAPGRGPVLVQGAMDVEIRRLTGALQHSTEETVGGWIFWRGTIDGYPVIVSKTLKGMSNAAAATALAADRYHPIAIINQGTAGGHVPELHVFDIVVGKEAVNIGSFKTGYRARGDGSNHAEWSPLDLMRTEGSAGQDPKARTLRRFRGDEGLLAAARQVRGEYKRGQVVEGVLGSSEVWNSELDRIQRFHDQYGTSAEEMETAAAAQIAGLFQIPFLGIRVVSNNITNGDAYEPKAGEAGQEYVLQVLKAYVAARSKRD